MIYISLDTNFLNISKYKNLEKLESLYQSGDYEGICEYLKKVGHTYQSYFDKYTEVE